MIHDLRDEINRAYSLKSQPLNSLDMPKEHANTTIPKISYTTQKAVGIIQEAAAAGVALLNFPEVWFPG